MKKLILIMLLFCQVLSAPPGYQVPVILQTEPLNNLEAIWQAVMFIESSNNPYAVNYEFGGFSIGVGQIRKIRVDDFNKRTSKKYMHDDCFRVDISTEIFMYYAKIIKNEELIVRRWNGSGPLTEIYWNKVKKYL